MSKWSSGCTFWGGARGELERHAFDARIEGTVDSFVCRKGGEVLAEGTYLGVIPITGAQLLAYAAAHPNSPHAARAATVIQRDGVSDRQCRKTRYVVIGAVVAGDEGFPPDGTRWLVLSGVGNSETWSAGARRSDPLSELAHAQGIELMPRSLRLSVDYLGGDPRRSAALAGASLLAIDGDIVLVAPKSGTEVLKITANEMMALSLGDHDRMKTLLHHGRWAVTGAVLGAVAGGLAGGITGGMVDDPLPLPGLIGSGASDGSALGLMAGAGASLASKRARRNHFVMLAGEREGFRYQAVLAAEPNDARLLVAEVQAQRFARGMSSLPTIEDLVHQDSLREQERQTEVLREIAGAQGAPDDPIVLLERLAALRDRGIVSADEFEAKRIELLKRI